MLLILFEINQTTSSVPINLILSHNDRYYLSFVAFISHKILSNQGPQTFICQKSVLKIYIFFDTLTVMSLIFYEFRAVMVII